LDILFWQASDGHDNYGYPTEEDLTISEIAFEVQCRTGARYSEESLHWQVQRALDSLEDQELVIMEQEWAIFDGRPNPTSPYHVTLTEEGMEYIDEHCLDDDWAAA
jgi:hypothetical protein